MATISGWVRLGSRFTESVSAKIDLISTFPDYSKNYSINDYNIAVIQNALILIHKTKYETALLATLSNSQLQNSY